MLCPSSGYFSQLSDSRSGEISSIFVSRIEMFVIPAIAVDSAGYRVCLRLTTNLGYGWSELFLDETEAAINLDRCSDLLVSFIGSMNLPLLHDFHYDKSDQEGRALDLLSAAVKAVAVQHGEPARSVVDSEEHVLRQRAISYISLV
jgi:hypothetical protein